MNCNDCWHYIPKLKFKTTCEANRDETMANSGRYFPAGCDVCSSKFVVNGKGCKLKHKWGRDEKEKL